MLQFLYVYCDFLYVTVNRLSIWRDQSHKSVIRTFRFLVKTYNMLSDTQVGLHQPCLNRDFTNDKSVLNCKYQSNLDLQLCPKWCTSKNQLLLSKAWTCFCAHLKSTYIWYIVTMKIIFTNAAIITGSTIALHCCKAHSKVNRKMENLTPL